MNWKDQERDAARQHQQDRDDERQQQDLDCERVELENAVATVCKYLTFTGYTALGVAVQVALGIAPTEHEPRTYENVPDLPY